MEAALLEHPEIADAAVIGLADTTAGELPCAFVVRQEGSEIKSSKVQEFIAGRKYMRIYCEGMLLFYYSEAVDVVL